MAFLEELLNPEISQGATFSVRSSVNIGETRSGREQRNVLHSALRRLYSIGFSERPKEQQDEIRNLYLRVTQADGFLFKDWSDFRAENEAMLFVREEGSDSFFQLVKRYGPSQVRRITKPVRGTVQIASGQGFGGEDAVDYSTGIVTLGSRSNPEGLTIPASFEFNVPVRFNDNTLDMVINYIENAEISDIQLIELFGEEAR